MTQHAIFWAFMVYYVVLGAFVIRAIWVAQSKPTPLFACCHQMKAKDPELYESIGHMVILDGVLEWRKKYPEDFPDLNASVFATNLIQMQTVDGQ